MARVTVEDCLEHVDNRFQLVLLAAKRARQLSRGTDEAKVGWQKDKATVVALREIAAGVITPAFYSDQVQPEVAVDASSNDETTEINSDDSTVGE